MTQTHPTAQPMAIPFKTNHFRLDRQVALEKQITASPLFQRVRKTLPEAGILEVVRDMGPAQMPLPEGACERLDRALGMLRTRARLAIPIQTTLVLGDSTRPTCTARRHEGALHLIVTAPLLETGDEALLRHRIAVGIFGAFHPLHDTLGMLLGARAPMEMEVWLATLEFLRLDAYMADCFALACTGDMAAALRAGFMAHGGCNPDAAGIDLRRLGEAQMASGQFSLRAQVLLGAEDIGWLPARPAVLEAFAASEIHRACDGLPGGMPRAAFEAAVLGLDRRAHPPLDGVLPEEICVFVRVSTLLVACALIEATGPTSPARLAPALDALEIDAEDLQTIRDAVDWDPMAADTSLARFAATLNNTTRRWANLHSVAILEQALGAALAENGGAFQEEMQSPLNQAGMICGLSGQEVHAILETFVARAKAAAHGE